MDLPVDPIHMSVEEILGNLQAGHREASASGPKATLSYLQRSLRESIDLPQAVLMVIYDLISETQAELQDWEGCNASMALAQEARKRARAEVPRPTQSPSLNSPLGNEVPFASTSLAGSAVSLLQTPTTDTNATQAKSLWEAAPVQVSSVKLCSSCGKDVTHRSRRKDPRTHTYLCLACCSKTPKRNGFKLKRPVVWAILISILILITSALLTLSLWGYI